MKKNPSKRDMHIKKLVSCAKSIITNQTTIPMGSEKMSKLIYWIESDHPVNGIDFKVINELNFKLSKYPIGTERLYWDKNSLREQDVEIDKIVNKYRNQFIDKCYEIIHNLDKNNH